MANIIIALQEDEQVFSGKRVSFKAPCTCEVVSGLKIGETVYSIVDAMGNSVVGKSGFFDTGSIVDVLLDCETNKAYIQSLLGNGIYVYTHDGDTLSGNGINGKFKATSTGNKTAFTINDKSYSVKLADETSVDIVSDSWYFFMLDEATSTINFSGGGGLSNSKLALATATAGNVIKGKTYYAQDKSLKTGTLDLSATATAADVASGKTFFAGNTTKKTGTLDVSTCISFKVVGGTSAPSSPAENTIWVNTSSTVSDYMLSTTQPTGNTGLVWIKVNANGTVDITKGKVSFDLSHCYIWNGSSWVTATAKVYKSGAWKTISESSVTYTYADVNISNTATASTTTTLVPNNNTSDRFTKQSDNTLKSNYVQKLTITGTGYVYNDSSSKHATLTINAYVNGSVVKTQAVTPGYDAGGTISFNSGVLGLNIGDVLKIDWNRVQGNTSTRTYKMTSFKFTPVLE